MKLHIRGLEAVPRVAQAKVVDRPGQSVKGLAISLKGYRPQATDHRPQTTGTSSNQKERWIFWWQFMPFWSHLIIYFTLVSSCPMANWSKVLEMAKSPPKKSESKWQHWMWFREICFSWVALLWPYLGLGRLTFPPLSSTLNQTAMLWWRSLCSTSLGGGVKNWFY